MKQNQLIYSLLVLVSLKLPTVVHAQETATDASRAVLTESAENQEQEAGLGKTTLKKKKSKKNQTKTETAPSTSSPTPSNVEKLQVTGSYVSRIDAEGPTPLVVWDRESIEVTGSNTVSDYLRESPLFENSSDSGNRDGNFRFRGQHAGSTLVLINGLRLPQLGGPDRGFYTGVEAIPTAIIDRVEILKDGSSALYGSDAMAGVMNFITRKDYDGAEFATRVTTPEAGFGIEQNHSLAFGKSYNRGSWFVTTQYVEQQGFNQADIGNFSRSPMAPLATDGSLNFKGAAESRLDLRQCPGGGTDCRMDTRSLDFVRDPRQNLGNLISGQFEITPDITWSAVGIYNRRQRTDFGRPFTVVSRNDLPVSQLGSNSLKQQGAGAESLSYRISALDEIGRREVQVVQDAFTAQTGLVGHFADTWRWDLSGSFARSDERRDHRNGLVSLDGVDQLLSQGYDPSRLGQNQGAFGDIGVRGIEGYQASQSMARFVASGDLFDFASLYGTGGAASIAMGAEGQWESTNDNHDRILIDSDLNQIFGENQFGSRNVSSVFTELVLYPLDQVELQLAGRYDRYSDFGDTINPKISLAYRPNNQVLFRGSWGTNFKAPALRNMMEQDRQTFEDFNLITEADPEGRRRNIPVLRYRDPNLGPELATNYNIGTVIQPNKQWTFTIDQWNFEGRNTIGGFSGLVYSDWARVIGTEGLADAGVTFEFDENGTPIAARAPLVTNAGSKTIRGIDIGTQFNNPVRLFGRVFRLGFAVDHTHMFVMNDRRGPNMPLIFREDLDWKNTVSATLRAQKNSFRVAARTIAGSTQQTFRGITRTHTEYDFNYDYDAPWNGRFNLGVKNVLNSPTPTNLGADFVDFTSSLSAYAFLPLGRRYYVGYSQSF